MCDCNRSENVHDRLIGIDQLIAILGEKSRQAVYNKVNRGVFPVPTYKIGKSLRWKLSEVQEYIEKLEPIT
jgi:predicted DNA-binding transcriptional regulator AlpA